MLHFGQVDKPATTKDKKQESQDFLETPPGDLPPVLRKHAHKRIPDFVKLCETHQAMTKE